MTDLVWVTRNLPATDGPPAVLHRLAGHERTDGDPAARAQLLGRVEATQRLDGCARHVHRVRGAMDLGKDVADARCLDDRADRTAGDDAGALGPRLQQHG